MADANKSKFILDTLQQLLEEAILDALIMRSYEQPLQTAKNLTTQTNVSSFTRMAMLFQACRSSSAIFNNNKKTNVSAQSEALLHQKHLHYLISELKPALPELWSIYQL